MSATIIARAVIGICVDPDQLYREATLNYSDCKPTDPAPDWTGQSQTMAERIHDCRMMLFLHGFLTAGENEKVKQRQVKRGMIPVDAIVVDRYGNPTTFPAGSPRHSPKPAVRPKKRKEQP